MSAKGDEMRKENEKGKALSRTNLAAIVAGNVLELYDFTVFAFFAVQIGRTMFVDQFGDVGLLATLASFGVGFIAGPIGAAVIGRYADTVGRKPAMMLSFVLMGTAMIVVVLRRQQRCSGSGAA